MSNTRAFPRSANAFDSLAEAYGKAGDTAMAIKNYEISLKLDPGNASGREALARLTGKKP